MPRANRKPCVISPAQIAAAQRLHEDRKQERSLLLQWSSSVATGVSHDTFRQEVVQRDGDRELLDRCVDPDGILNGRGRPILTIFDKDGVDGLLERLKKK